MNLHQIAAVTLVVGFTVLGIHNVADNQNKLHIQNIQVKSKNAELKSLELKYDSLQIELNKTDSSHQEKIKQLELEKQKLEQERQRLEGELQAKKASKLQVASTTIPGTATAHAASGGSCASLMAAAGIPNTHAANALIGGESGCQVGRLNTSSYACGIGQSYPCTKMYPHATTAWINANKFQVGGKWFIPGDALTELRWMKAYTINRYGSFENAYAIWLSRSPHWY